MIPVQNDEKSGKKGRSVDEMWKTCYPYKKSNPKEEPTHARKKILALSLVLALSLALCACGESGGNDTADQAGPLSGGTWTEQPDGSTDPMEYMTTILQDDIPEDWTLPEDVSIGSQTRWRSRGIKSSTARPSTGA